MRKSSRVKFQTKQDYIPSITGSKYAVAVDQLEYHGEIHQYAHMFFMKRQEEKTDFIIAITTQLLFKAGLKEWGSKSHNTVH